MLKDPVTAFFENRTAANFATLVRRTRDRVVDVASGIAKDPEIAEKIAAEVFRTLVRARWRPAELGRFGVGILLSETASAAWRHVRNRRPVRDESGPDPLVKFLEFRSRQRFARLIGETRESVFNVAYRYLTDATRAEKVTRDVYLGLLESSWRSDDLLPASRHDLARLALDVARRLLPQEEDQVRRIARKRLLTRALHPRIGLEASQRDLWSLWAALVTLPAILRTPAELRYFGALQIEAIAATLGVSLCATRRLLLQAASHLEWQLSPSAAELGRSILVGERHASWPRVLLSQAAIERFDELAKRGGVRQPVASSPARKSRRQRTSEKTGVRSWKTV